MKKLAIGMTLVLLSLLCANCCIRPMCSVEPAPTNQMVEPPGTTPLR